MTDGLRISHLRKAQVGLSEVGLPEGNLCKSAHINDKDGKNLIHESNMSEIKVI